MSTQSIIEHKANMYYIEFREDYLAICLNCTYKKPIKGKEKSKASAYCKALILAISENWTNDKRSHGGDLSFYMTYPQWIDAMYGMFGRNVVIDSVDELIGEELLSKEPVKYKGKDTFRYTLNYAEINRRMKNLPDRAPHHTSPQVNAFTNQPVDESTRLQVNGKAFTSKRDTSLQVNGKAFTSKRNIESTNHPYTESTQNTESSVSRESEPTPVSADAPHTHAFSQNQDVIISGHDYQADHLDVNCALWRRMNGGTCQDYQNAADRALDPSQAGITLKTEGSEPLGRDVQPGPALISEGQHEAPQQHTLMAVRQVPAKLSTGRGSSPQGRGKAERTSAALTQGKKQYQVYFSTEGQMFRQWYEELTGFVLDETAANAAACNKLGKKGTMTRDNLEIALKAIEADKWVQANNVVIGPQELAKDDGSQRWEKWLQTAQTQQRRKDAKPTSASHQSNDDYSPLALARRQQEQFLRDHPEVRAELQAEFGGIFS